MKKGKLLLGVMAGIAAGTLLGILIAPEKGSRTRRKIANKGEDYADALNDKLTDMTDNITKKYNQTMKEAEAIIEKGNQRLRSLINDNKPA